MIPIRVLTYQGNRTGSREVSFANKVPSFTSASDQATRAKKLIKNTNSLPSVTEFGRLLQGRTFSIVHFPPTLTLCYYYIFISYVFLLSLKYILFRGRFIVPPPLIIVFVSQFSCTFQANDVFTHFMMPHRLTPVFAKPIIKPS